MAENEPRQIELRREWNKSITKVYILTLSINTGMRDGI